MARLTEKQRLILEFHNYKVPCIFAMAQPECMQLAEWLVTVEHAVKDECPDDDAVPMCDHHRRIAENSFGVGFWAMWLGIPKLCPTCSQELALGDVEPLPKGE